MPSIDLASPDSARGDVTPDSIGYAIGEGRGADAGAPVRHPAGGGGRRPRRRPCRASDRPPAAAAASHPDGDAVMLASLTLPDHGRPAIGADHGLTCNPDAGDPPPHAGRALRPHPARRAADVVSSLWDVRQRYPESWGWLGGLDDTVRLCDRYLHATTRARGHNDTFIMLNNDPIEHNTATLRRWPPRRAGHPPDPACRTCARPFPPHTHPTDTAGSAGEPAGRSTPGTNTMIRLSQVTAGLLQGDTTPPSNDDPAVSLMPSTRCLLSCDTRIHCR